MSWAIRITWIAGSFFKSCYSWVWSYLPQINISSHAHSQTHACTISFPFWPCHRVLWLPRPHSRAQDSGRGSRPLFCGLAHGPLLSLRSSSGSWSLWESRSFRVGTLAGHPPERQRPGHQPGADAAAIPACGLVGGHLEPAEPPVHNWGCLH